MKLADQPRGYIFALIATLAMANVYVFSKAALNQLSLYQFGFYWFGLAIVWNVIYGIPAGKIAVARLLKKKDIIVLVVIGVLELIGTSLFFLSIETTSVPAVMSFLQNLTPLFVIILGATVLGERFSGLEIIGMLVILAGAIVTSYTGKLPGKGIFVPGTGFMVGSTLFLATTTIISKKYIKSLDPLLLSLNRSVYLFVAAAIFIIMRGESLIIPTKAFFNTMIGSFLGPFLTAVSMYSALKYIEASKSTIIQSSKGLFVTIGAWIYFSSIPKDYQILGGLLTIAGVIIMISAKRKIQATSKASGRVATK